MVYICTIIDSVVSDDNLQENQKYRTSFLTVDLTQRVDDHASPASAGKWDQTSLSSQASYPQLSDRPPLPADLFQHITKRHQHNRFQQEMVEEYGLVACVCGRVVRNAKFLLVAQ
jgi:hypothetical protein